MIKKTFVIVITGATSGIGKTTAEYLLEKGHIIYSLSRRVLNNPSINYISCDVSKEEEIKNALSEIIKKEKRIDIIINNAGIGISGAIEYQSDIDISNILNVNLKGLINVSKLAIPYLRETKGKIINIGSIAGELAIPFQTMYSVTKSAIHIFTLSLANELRPFDIKVSCVMPGDTKTSFTINRKKEEKNDFYDNRINDSIKRMEKDEQNGSSPLKVSKVIYKCIKMKNPPLKVAVDFKYRFLLFISRFMSNKLINKILYIMYAK